MKHYDLLVAGGGPAGLYAAYEAAACREMRIAVIEKDDEIGQPIICAEGISVNTIKSYFPQGDKIDFIRNKFSRFILIYKGRKAEMSIPDMGVIVDRGKFDRHIAEMAVKRGVDIITGENISEAGYRDGGIFFKTDREEYTGDVGILADGVESTLSGHFSLNGVCPLEDIYSCYQYVFRDESIKDDEIIFDFSPEFAPGGYLWVFPRGGGTANFGLGVSGHIKGKRAKQLLEEYREAYYPNGEVLHSLTGAVPVNPMKRIYSDNIMVCGDAARYADPITGGGIDNAVRTGKFAGITAGMAFTKKDFSSRQMANYQDFVEKDNLYSIKKQLQLRKMMLDMNEEEMDRFFASVMNLIDGREMYSSDFYSFVTSLRSTVKTAGLMYNFLGSLMKDKYLLKIIMRLLWQ